MSYDLRILPRCDFVTVKKIDKNNRIYSFDEDVKKWLESLGETLRLWGNETVRRARDTLLDLYDAHRIPPQALLTELTLQKRVALMKDRQRKQGITANIAGLKKAVVKGGKLHKIIEAARKNPVAMEYLGISASLERASEMLQSNPQPRRGAPKKTQIRAMLLPLVEVLIARTGKPL